MRFGLTGFPLGQMNSRLGGTSGEIVERIARHADDCGFDFVCAQDHTVAPRTWAEDGAGTSWFEPFVTLAFAAAVTSRVRLLTDVVVLPLRSPFQVAKAGASLDDLSGGRLVLGVASGYLEAEFEILGASFDDRGARTDEAIEAIKHAWTHEWIDFGGDFYRARDAAVAPRPVQRPRPPIWVGGNSMRALRRAVEHADGWNPFRATPERLAEALSRAGRPSIDVCVPLRRGVYADDGATLDVASIRRQIDAFAEAGATHLKVALSADTVDGYLGSMERFAQAIIGA